MPAGAYLANPSLAGRVELGFAAKYPQNGGTVPVGTNAFKFKAANLTFLGTQYDSGSLVRVGKKATIRGSGTINNVAGYRFLVAAIDGNASGGTGPDTFRIKIWNAATGAVVYDNQAGAPDDADPTMVLGGGEIVLK